jgi:hypothetical protein
MGLACLPALQAQQLSGGSTAPTPVPRVVWFSGAFHPADGLPIAPVETVTLAVYHEEQGGDPLWQESHNVVVDAVGRYSVLMGSASMDGVPPSLFTTGEPRWLGVRFSRAGEREQPRVPLASVPYALKAADADTLGGKPASAYLLADPPASSGTSAPLAKGSKAQTAGSGASLSSSGTAGWVGKFVNTTDLDNSVMFQSGPFIGLGTTSPQDYFHVSFDDQFGAYTGLAVQNRSSGANASSGMLFYDQNGALAQFQGFSNTTHEYRINNIASGGAINFLIGSSSKLLLANNGNVTFTGMRTQASQNGPTFLSANVIGGSTANITQAGVTGVVIAGGGATNGFPQTINANYSSILGGYSNTVTANGFQSTIAGGVANTASSSNVAIGGGTSNTASGSGATVPGGSSNTAAGSTSFAAGNRAKAVNTGSFVWGDSTNADVTSTANDQMTIRASGGVALTVNATNGASVPVGTLYKDNAIVAWGRVTSNALVESFNVASVSHNSAGNYSVQVNAVAFTGFALPVVSVSYPSGSTPTTAATVRIATTGLTGFLNVFSVFINSGTFAPTDADFTFIVTGR